MIFQAEVRLDQVEIHIGNLKDATFLASLGLFGKVRKFWTENGIFELTDDGLKEFQDQK